MRTTRPSTSSTHTLTIHKQLLLIYDAFVEDDFPDTFSSKQFQYFMASHGISLARYIYLCFSYLFVSIKGNNLLLSIFPSLEITKRKNSELIKSGSSSRWQRSDVLKGRPKRRNKRQSKKVCQNTLWHQ